MDYDLTRYSPDAISGAATGLGYSMQAVVANLVATFIRGFGYQTTASLRQADNTGGSFPGGCLRLHMAPAHHHRYQWYGKRPTGFPKCCHCM